MGHSNLKRRWKTIKPTPLSYKRISNKRKKTTNMPCKDLTKVVKSRTWMKTILPTVILSPMTTNIDIWNETHD
jgi:hypothetical protein